MAPLPGGRAAQAVPGSGPATSAEDLRAGQGGALGAPAVNLADLQPAPTIRSAPLLSLPGLGSKPQPAPGARGTPGCALQSSETPTEPFPRLRQVSGGPGKLAYKSPRKGWQLPAAAGGSGRRAPPRTRTQRSRAQRTHAHPRVTFGSSQVSPPVLAAAQPHGSCPACCWHPRLLQPVSPGCAAEVRPRAVPSWARDCVRSRRPGFPLPHALSWPRAAGISAPGRPC